MVPAPFIVVVDANVLFPFTLRDTILRAAAAGFYQLRWSAQILDEMENNLVSKRTIPPDKAARLRSTMEKYFPEAEVTGYQTLVAAMRARTPKPPRTSPRGFQLTTGGPVFVSSNSLLQRLDSNQRPIG
jgi:hypothetical protein